MDATKVGVSQDETGLVGSTTYLAHATRALERIAHALELPSGASAKMTGMLADLFGPLGARVIPDRAPWPSGISDDASPYELSLAMGEAGPEVRVLWESQGSSGDLQAKMRAGLETQQRLAERFGASSARLDLISDLFLPPDPQGAFVIWHAARLWPAQSDPELKVYLNPQVRGRTSASAVVEEALARLGFEGAWPAVGQAMSRGPDLDEILYFSLDLWGGDAARVKIYFQHHDPTLDALRAVARTSPAADPEHVARFYRAVTADRAAWEGHSVLTNDHRPPPGVSPGSCLSFVASAGPRPVAMTLHVAVRAHVVDDEEACQRSAMALPPHDAAAHRRAVTAMARRPLEAGRGLTSWVSLRSQGERSRTTVYLSAECFSFLPRLQETAPTPTIPPVERLVEQYEAEPLTLHPFFQRMLREPVDLRKMWFVFHNASIGISRPFPRWLGHAIGRVEDDRIRCILAEQLYEELGSGNPDLTHRKLFLRTLSVFDPWKPETITPEMEAPGHELAETLEAIYFDEHPYTAVGAAIVIELLGKHGDLFVGEQLRRQSELDLGSLEWLTQHETLELDHADESVKLASYIERPEDRAAAWRGGRRVFAAGWNYYSRIYDLTFGRSG